MARSQTQEQETAEINQRLRKVLAAFAEELPPTQCAVCDGNTLPHSPGLDGYLVTGPVCLYCQWEQTKNRRLGDAEIRTIHLYKRNGWGQEQGD